MYNRTYWITVLITLFNFMKILHGMFNYNAKLNRINLTTCRDYAVKITEINNSNIIWQNVMVILLEDTSHRQSENWERQCLTKVTGKEESMLSELALD